MAEVYVALARMYGWSPQTVNRLTPEQTEIYLGKGKSGGSQRFKTLAEAQEFLEALNRGRSS